MNDETAAAGQPAEEGAPPSTDETRPPNPEAAAGGEEAVERSSAPTRDPDEFPQEKTPPDGSDPPPSGDPDSSAPPTLEELSEPKNVINIFTAGPGSTMPTDPTAELAPGADEPRFLHLQPHVGRYVDDLIRVGAMIVSCAHRDVARRAALEVAFDPQLDARRRRIWFLDTNPGSLDENVRSGRLRHLGNDNGAATASHGAIFVVSISRREALDELVSNEGPIFENPVWLRDPVSLVFCVSGDLVDDPKYSLFLDQHRHWRLSAVEEILRDAGVPDAEMNELTSALSASHVAGAWGADRQAFLQTIDGILRRGGAEKLREEIRLRSATDQHPARRAQEILDTANPAQKTALFLAAHFAKMDAHRFVDLMTELAEDETVETTRTETVEAADGTSRSRVIRDCVPAIAYWEQNERTAMATSGLCYARADEAGLCIAFEDATVREAIRSRMSATYRYRRFDTLYRIGLLFDREISDAIASELIDLTLEMAEHHPRAYGASWLLTQFFTAVGAMPREGAPSRFVIPDSGVRDDHVMKRFGLLCKGFLASDRMAKTVHAFIEQLIQATQPDVGNVVYLLGQLRGAEAIDPISTCKRLTNVGNVEACRAVMSWLVGEMDHHRDGQWALLEKVAAWLPTEPASGVWEISGSQRWSLAFLYMVYERARQEREGWQRRHPEPWRMPILDADDGRRLAPERLDLLGTWLEHPAFLPTIDWILLQTTPGWYSALSRVLLSGARPAEFCRAEVLEFLYLVDARGSIEAWAPTFAAALPRDERLRLRALLRFRADLVRLRLTRASRREQPFLNDQRRSLFELTGILAEAAGKEAR